MRDKDYSAATSFLASIFHATEHAVELRACPNVKGATGAASIMTTTDAERIAFCERKDGDGLGVYFGVCTRATGVKSGNLETVAECPALWVDIDCAKQELSGQVVLDTLAGLPVPPSIIVNSGGGLHAYWILEEAVAVAPGSAMRQAATDALRALAHVLAGDTQCAELARIMRLPGTLNTKPATLAIYDGQPFEAKVLTETGRVYDFEQLCEWLADQRALLHGKTPAARAVVEDDPFTRYAREAGYNPALDVEAALAAMGDGNIHETQLRVTAAMLARGHDEDEIVDTVLRATESAAPGDARWNWNAEERAIRKMVASARAKGFDKPREKPASVPQVSGNNALAVVHDMEAERAKRAPKSDPDEKQVKVVAIAEAVIAEWQSSIGPIMHSQGDTWAYSGGVWEKWSPQFEQRIRIMIQRACRAFTAAPTTSTLNAAYRYVMECPELEVHNVEFDKHCLIIAANGAIDADTGERQPHSPEHYARWKVAASITEGAACPTWLQFLADTFADKGPDAVGFIDTLQEWFGAALVTEKARPFKMGLIAHGPSRTGKTQIAIVARGLLGAKNVSNASVRQIEGRFGLEPFLGKRGWIADDAIGEGEYLDADRYKKIVTGEGESVECKGGKNVETAFGFPVMLTANSLPRVRDQSSAVYNRSLIVPCTCERPETAPEPVGYNSIAEKIVAEDIDGILWWAIEGWKRLKLRGFYDPPRAMTEARRGFEADNNPVGSWREECVDFDPSFKVSRPDLLASMNGWWSQEYGADQKPWSGRGFFPRLCKMMPGYDPRNSETTDAQGQRYLIGVSLNQAGLIAWRTHKDSRWGEGSKTSTDEALVNKEHAAPERKGRTVF